MNVKNYTLIYEDKKAKQGYTLVSANDREFLEIYAKLNNIKKYEIKEDVWEL